MLHTKPRYNVMGLASSGGVEYWEYFQVSAKGNFTYWMPKHKGVTWIKLSTKHGDWGWNQKERNTFRVRHLGKVPPYSASKRGALRVAIAETRLYIKNWGDDWGDEGEEQPPSVHLKTFERAYKRMKK